MKLILEKMIFQSTMKFETKTTTWTVTKTLQLLEKLSYLSPEYIVSQFLYLVISELCLLTTKIQKIIISTKKIKAHGPPSDSSKKLKKIPDFQPCKKLCLISISIYSLILILDLPFCQNIPLTIIQTPNSMVLSTSIVDIDFCHFNHPGFWTLDSINFLLMSAIYFHTDNWLAMMKTPDPTTKWMWLQFTMTPWYSSAMPPKMIRLFNFRTHLPISLHIDQDNNRSNSIQSFPIGHYYTLETLFSTSL